MLPRSSSFTIYIACLVLFTGSHATLLADELWLAVGYGGRRMISTDGLNWTITAQWSQPGAMIKTTS